MANLFTQKHWLYWFFTASRIAEEGNLALLDTEFREAFLVRGSPTWYNLKAVEHISFGAVSRASNNEWEAKKIWRTFGLRFRHHPLLLSHIFEQLIHARLLTQLRRHSKLFHCLDQRGYRKLIMIIYTVLKLLERREESFFYDPDDPDSIPPRPALYPRIAAFRLCTIPLMLHEMPLEILNHDMMEALEVAVRYSWTSPLPEDFDTSLEGVEYGVIEVRLPQDFEQTKYIIKYLGLCLTDCRFSIADFCSILNHLPIPQAVTKAFPQLSEDDWKACMHVAFVIMWSLEATVDEQIARIKPERKHF